MSEVVRWFLAGVAIMLVVFLVVVARGHAHHRGDDIGSFGVTASVTRA